MIRFISLNWIAKGLAIALAVAWPAYRIHLNFAAAGFLGFAVALLVSWLSSHLRREAERAARHENELRTLYEMARRLLLLDRQTASAADVASLLFETLPIESLVLFEPRGDRCHCRGSDASSLEARTRGAYLTELDLEEDAGSGIRTLVLRRGSQTIGALTIAPATLMDASLHALASLVAIALATIHSAAQERRAEAVSTARLFRKF